MTLETFSALISLVGIVIIVGSLISGIAERHNLPLVAVFVVLGAALGPHGLAIMNIHLQSPALHVLSVLALALVLFSDAVAIDVKELRARWPLVWRVLGPGTLLPALLMTLAARFLLDLSWAAAAILGAAMASTDPVLLRTIVRSRALPMTSRIALRIETGMNDVVLLPIVIIAMLTLPGGGGHGDETVGSRIVGLFLLGPLAGLLVGWVGIRLLSTVRRSVGVRRDYESLYALGLAFTAFAAAESVGGSGFLAAFAAGLMINSQDEELCDCFLEYGEATAEMLLLLTFVALGMSLIWTGADVISPGTLAFAVVAVTIRTIVLWPMLASAGIVGRERRLIAIFGPRGLSSLLLVLLPVFVGIPGADHLFRVACLAVLLSVIVHGAAMAIFMRRSGVGPAVETGRAGAPGDRTTAAAVDAKGSGIPRTEPGTTAEEVPLLITLQEMEEVRRNGEPFVLADVRSETGWNLSDAQADGALRLDPLHAPRTAAALQIDRRSTIALYCA